MKTALGMIVALLLAAPCLGADLYIDLRTNYSPATDFGSVRVEVFDRADERNQWVAIDTSHPGTDYVRGARVAEFSDLQPGRVYLIVVRVLDGRMRVVDGRMALLDMPASPFGTIMVMSRR